MKTGDFQRFLEQSGVRVSRQSLNNWNHAILENTEPVKKYESVGRPGFLTETESRSLVGGVLEKNEQGLPVTAKTIVSMAKEDVGIAMSSNSAHSFLVRHGLSSRLAKRSSNGYKLKNSQLAIILSRWIRENRESGLLSHATCEIGSIDCTFTRHTTTRTRTFSVKGG